MVLRRYVCPACGGGLSRTLTHPRWNAVEAGKPAFRMPLLSVSIGVVVVGLGLSLLHPALGVTGVLALGGWVGWRYFSSLQCDPCSRFFVGGQLDADSKSLRPVSKAELRRLGVRMAACSGVLLAVLLPIKYVERVTRQNCDARCAHAGKGGEVLLYKCHCVTTEDREVP